MEMAISAWLAWLMAAGVVVILELFTGTFYLLMMALGLLAGSLVAWFGGGPTLQFLVAGIVATLATLILRRSKWGKLHKTEIAQDRNVNLDIGQTLHVDQWQADGARHTARILYRGAQWDVELLHGCEVRPGTCVIREVRGNRLIVAPQA